MKSKKQYRPEHSGYDVALMSFADVVSSEYLTPEAGLPPNHPAVTTLADFRTLDEGEVLEGYLDGVHGGSSPEPERSRSYRHGWRNGMVDRGSLPPDDAMHALQHDFDRLR